MVPKENSLKMLKNRNNQIVADLSKFIEKMKGIKRFFEYWMVLMFLLLIMDF